MNEKEYLRLCARVIKEEQPCDIRTKADYLLKRVRQLLRENARLKKQVGKLSGETI